MAALLVSLHCNAWKEGETPSFSLGDTIRDERSHKSDACDEHSHKLTTRQVIIPAAMTATGFALTYCKQKEWLNDRLQDINHGHRIRIDDYAQFLPIATTVLAGSFGVPHKHGFIDRALMTFTSSLVMFGVSRTLKHFTWEERPGGDGTNSFPSGHTTTAFTGAELARLEYGGATGIAAYSVAGLVGFLRIYNNKHWVNDVLAGAGIGILSARLGYWLLPYEKRLINNIARRIRHDSSTDSNTSFIIMPYYDNTAGYGCSVAINL